MAGGGRTISKQILQGQDNMPGMPVSQAEMLDNTTFKPVSGSSGGKGGGTPVSGGTSLVSTGPKNPLAPSSGFNVNEAAAGGLEQAMLGTQAAMGGPDIQQFMNPYTQEVTDNLQADLERQRQMTMNTMGAQASNAGAFGGSRHGVAEGITNEGFARQGATALGNLRQQGFNTALQAAQAQQGMQMGGAAQLGALGGQAFNTSQAIQNQQARQGLLQQGMQQALIDAAKGQYGGYTGAPANSLGPLFGGIGTVGELGAQTRTDSNNPGLGTYLQTFMGMGGYCWVAREVYGEQDPKWMQFREWVIGHSPDWFYKAYSNYGEKFAKVVRKVPAIKVILRPFMDAKRKSIGYKI